MVDNEGEEGKDNRVILGEEFEVLVMNDSDYSKKHVLKFKFRT